MLDMGERKLFGARGKAAFSSGGGLTTGGILNLAPAAWFRFGLGTTVATGVSQWDDASGNGRHLKQAVGVSQPALQADGSILFDGTDDFLRCDAFTLNQPETVYLLARQVTWTNGEHVFDGFANGSGRILQLTATPSISLNAGLSAAANTNWTVNTYAALCCQFNGASSILRVNNTTETTGDASTGNMGGFTLGASGNSVSWGNIQVKEILIFPAAHDAARRAQMIAYLMRIGGL